jgi:ankyrin repeat protein/tRNA A-37 threonylcarbamoyl transferase component Bud32
MINCNKCKTENEDSADYCEHCGDKLASKTVCCPVCGLYNKDKAKFCNSCGTNLITGKEKEWILDNRYKILGEIKSGAMGAVYQALDQRLDIKVAVKKLFNNGGNADDIKKSQDMFRREAAILASLHHLCLPKVNDYFSAPDENGRSSNFLVMSLIEGEDLETYLGRNKLPLPLEKAKEFILKISDILEYLHSQTPPVIHRDLKPSSIMLCNGNLYLVDFGIAKALEGSRTGTMIGTPGYASPDQCRGNDHISNDIYSLGVLFHYLLTGRNPEIQTNNLFTFEPVRKQNPQVPEHIETLIASMVEMRIADRPGSAGEVRERLNIKSAPQKAKKTAKKTPPPPKPKISEDEFFNAVKSKDLDTVKKALAQGLSVNVRNKDGYTPLHRAAWEGLTAMVELLISLGADVNAKDNDGFMPLYHTAYKGHTATAELLILRGADVNEKDNKGLTPLHHTAYRGHTATAELLISKGADVNAKGNDGFTPLHLAAWEGHATTTKLLISKGADVNAKDNNGRTPLQCADREGHTAVVELLKPKISEDEFLNAAKSGDLDAVKTAIDQGMNINLRNEYGWTTLHWAAYRGDTASAKLLISKGADVNAKDNVGWTPLHKAASQEHTITVELLVFRGADVNAKTINGWTPLQFAAYRGDTASAELLRKYGGHE